MSLIYLYADPFVYDDLYQKTQPYLENNWVFTTEEEKQEIAQIYRVILLWAEAQSLIAIEGNVVTVRPPEFERSWQWRLLYGNWRFSASQKWYNETMEYLQNDSQISISLVLGLHANLGMMFDTSVLNKLCNRVMQSISAVPIPIDKSDTRQSWKNVHVQSPYWWILILLQTLITTSKS